MIKRVLITGATGVIGRAIAQHIVEQDWEVVVTSRDFDRAQALAAGFVCNAGMVHGLDLDLTDTASVESFSERLTARGLSVSHLVNNARLLDGLIVEDDGTTTAAHFRTELEVDVIQPYRLTMALARHPDHPLRAVVNIGSQYGLVAPNAALYDGTLMRSPVQYGTAKAALHHLTRELAARLAPDIRVNCVAFGGFVGRSDADFVSRYSAMVPAGRMLEPAEAGGPVAFLLDESSSAVNGHILVADGGWTAW
jgi:NAD(P)-dependent dehydrogenase (short-subunit alcohol dehydrogenase family)